jgi:opacity protein-like surface antigen
MTAAAAAAPAAGAAAMNPWAQVGGMFAMGLGSSIGGGQPGIASGHQDSRFDASGWNVNFGAGRIDSDMTKRESGPMGQLDGYLPYALMFVGVMIVWRMTRKS